jgi:hypothetical protein
MRESLKNVITSLKNETKKRLSDVLHFVKLHHDNGKLPPIQWQIMIIDEVQ